MNSVQAASYFRVDGAPLTLKISGELVSDIQLKRLEVTGTEVNVIVCAPGECSDQSNFSGVDVTGNWPTDDPCGSLSPSVRVIDIGALSSDSFAEGTFSPESPEAVYAFQFETSEGSEAADFAFLKASDASAGNKAVRVSECPGATSTISPIEGSSLSCASGNQLSNRLELTKAGSDYGCRLRSSWRYFINVFSKTLTNPADPLSDPGAQAVCNNASDCAFLVQKTLR